MLLTFFESFSLVSGRAEWVNPPPPPSRLGGLLLLGGSGASLDAEDLCDKYRLVLVRRRESLLTIMTRYVLFKRPNVIKFPKCYVQCSMCLLNEEASAVVGLVSVARHNEQIVTRGKLRTISNRHRLKPSHFIIYLHKPDNQSRLGHSSLSTILF